MQNKFCTPIHTACRMRRHQMILYIAGISLLLMTMTGCVFLRLFKLKQQLHDVERYLRIEDRNGLTITFLEPVMLMKDIAWLARAKPTSETVQDQHVAWEYVFEKQFSSTHPEQGDFEISQTLFFHANKLWKAAYSENLAPILKREFVIASLKAMGKGQVHKQNRSLSTLWDAEHAPPVPAKSEIERILGQPTSMWQAPEDESTLTCFYKYILRLNPADQRSRRPAVRLWLTYHQPEGRLHMFELKFSGMTTLITFPEHAAIAQLP